MIVRFLNTKPLSYDAITFGKIVDKLKIVASSSNKKKEEKNKIPNEKYSEGNLQSFMPDNRTSF